MGTTLTELSTSIPTVALELPACGAPLDGSDSTWRTSRANEDASTDVPTDSTKFFTCGRIGRDSTAYHGVSFTRIAPDHRVIAVSNNDLDVEVD